MLKVLLFLFTNLELGFAELHVDTIILKALLLDFVHICQSFDCPLIYFDSSIIKSNSWAILKVLDYFDDDVWDCMCVSHCHGWISVYHDWVSIKRSDWYLFAICPLYVNNTLSLSHIMYHYYHYMTSNVWCFWSIFWLFCFLQKLKPYQFTF